MGELNLSILLIIGIGLFIGSIILRSKSNNKYDIKAVDLTLIILPFFAWLLLTGRIERIAFGGVEVEVAETFISASTAPIDSQITRTKSLPIDQVVETVERASKSGIDRIPTLIKNKTESLEFTLEHGGYWGPAIKLYFESLMAHSFLKYTVIHNKNGSLFGVYNAQTLSWYLNKEKYTAYKNFANYLNKGTTQSKEALSKFPGFISAEIAVNPNSNKRAVLEQMEKLNLDTLPVVNEQNQFVGVIDRTRLTASLIIEVSKKLEKTVK